MDEQLQTSSLYKSRGFSGRLSESFKFLEKNFKQIFKVSILGLIPIGVLSALTMTFFSIQQMEGPMAIVWLSLMVCFSLVASLYFHSFVYAMLEKYGELGYVPSMKLKAWWPLMKKKMGRVFLCDLFMGVFVVVCLLIVYIPFLVSAASAFSSPVPVPFPVWGIALSLILFFVFIFIAIPLFLMPNFYLLGSQSLMGSFTQSYKLGVPHWGSMFGIALLTLILTIIGEMLGALPYYITVLVDYLIALAAEDGNTVTLPFYYVSMRVTFAFLASVIAYYASLLIVVPMAFQYASLVTMRKEKEEELRAQSL